MLSEIASRALSPAVNDPGTAIAVLEAGTRVLAAILSHRPTDENTPPAGVVVPPLAFDDLIENLYRPIARDGAGMLEVGIRLRKSLLTLAGLDRAARPGCIAASTDAWARAEVALTSEADRDSLSDCILLSQQDFSDVLGLARAEEKLDFVHQSWSCRPLSYAPLLAGLNIWGN